jgi:uncharacterized protein YbjT (DUF2867 family)
VAGAAGRTGRLVVADARAAGLYVRGLTRAPANEQQLRGLGVDEVVVGDLLDPQTAARAATGMDAVVSTVGATDREPGRERIFTVGVTQLIDAVRADDAAHLVLLTSLGVGRSAAAVQPAFRASRGPILAAMARAEAHLRGSGLPYTIVRPGRLTDEDATHDVLVGEGGTAIGSGTISRADVARLLVAALLTPEAQGRTFEILSRADARAMPGVSVTVPWRFRAIADEPTGRDSALRGCSP